MVKMASKRCYYEVLGVDRSATEGQIAEAYRKLALKYHPDRNPDDEEAVANFKEAAEAFEVLNNKEKRARYDRHGHAGLEGAGGGAPQFHDVGDIFEAFGDIFGDLFGGGRRSRGRRVHRGGHVRCETTVDLIEAAHGTSKSVEYHRHVKCETCGGTGAKPGTQPEYCKYCGGKGQVVQSTGIFSLQTTCPSCRGNGKIIPHPCSSCRGGGYVQKKVTRNVAIPAGVDDQTQLRLQGEGDPSPNGGPSGDCFVSISVKAHPLFQREGQHVICQVPISYCQAALGATIEVPTLDGRDQLEIPAGTQNGKVFKLKGCGMPHVRYRGRGDLLVQVHVEVPKKLTAEHDELLRKLAELENRDVTPQRKSFFKKLKEYFQSN